MKTAMQELIELIENGETELYLIENHKQIWLEREKEQIVKAINTLCSNDNILTAEQYYNQTYEQSLQEQNQDLKSRLDKAGL